MLRSGLGADVDDVFASFDRTPLAAASIAQVHAATLGKGDRVVLKVRRPDIEMVVAWDLDIVDRLARRLWRNTRWGRGVGAVDLSNGFAAALREELDLRDRGPEHDRCGRRGEHAGRRCGGPDTETA